MTFKQKVEEKGFIFYGDESLLKYFPNEKEKGNIELFTLEKNISDDELEKEYKNRGLIPASPEAILKLNSDKPIGTHWKDAEGVWCFAAFIRFRWDDGRGVQVYRRVSDWFVGWWFCGIKKEPSLALENQNSSDTRLQTFVSELEILIKKYK